MKADQKDVDELLDLVRRLNEAQAQAAEAIAATNALAIELQGKVASPEVRRAYLEWADANVLSESNRPRAQAVRNLLIHTIH